MLQSINMDIIITNHILVRIPTINLILINIKIIILGIHTVIQKNILGNIHIQIKMMIKINIKINMKLINIMNPGKRMKEEEAMKEREVNKEK